ncbi:hypothetical protein YC2023_011067 [Brassica napus]
MALDVSGNSLTGKLPVWISQNGSHDNSTRGIKKIQEDLEERGEAMQLEAL